ncbi:DUF5590 domain-containing protein [Sporosarcina ureae]|uniref:Cell wall elongation regulator TseB-like domain-containing protein n=1 Tax=Sporosarcina ureae TaxID=1571 RepID=A0ABN4YW41_SPOUR|nr:DUF5590 domain-containing protein [Sporosarcina ureae]ARF15499.1 hypothetical protein SporoS204_15840 [Sporosarcina ureae]
MLNWIKFLFLFLLALGFTITCIVFYQAEKPFAASEKVVKKAVLANNVLEKVDKMDHFHGKTSWITVYGTDKNNHEKIIFVEEKTTKILKAVSIKDGITKPKATDIVKKEKNVKKVLNASLGMENDTPFWEVSYLDDEDFLNYAYLNFADGKWLKRISKL